MKKAKTKKFKIRCSFSKLSPCVFPYCEGCGFKMCYEQGKKDGFKELIDEKGFCRSIRRSEQIQMIYDDGKKQGRTATLEEVLKNYNIPQHTKVPIDDILKESQKFHKWLSQQLKEAKG